MATVLVNLVGVRYTYLTHPLLADLNLEIQAGQKIGLVGANGCGKSTLLRLITGRLAAEAGVIFRAKGLSIGHLPQDARSLLQDELPPEGEPAGREGRGQADPGSDGGPGRVTASGPAPTVLDAALAGSPEIARLRRQLGACERQMGDPAVYSQPARLAGVMDQHARLLNAYEAAGGLTYENRVRSTLRELGLGDSTFDQPLDTLSGGQAKLVGLARLLVWQPDLLLLDEPDNHLDAAGKDAVERLVQGFPGAVVIVSHDRYLLDQVADRIAELDAGRITIWPGTYSAYAMNRQLARLRQEQLHKAQQKRIA